MHCLLNRQSVQFNISYRNINEKPPAISYNESGHPIIGIKYSWTNSALSSTFKPQKVGKLNHTSLDSLYNSFPPTIRQQKSRIEVITVNCPQLAYLLATKIHESTHCNLRRIS